MQTNRLSRIRLTLMVLGFLIVPGIGSYAAPAAAKSALPPPTTLFLVGDSTVCGFNDPYYYPRYGYGTQLGTYLNPNVTINNLALSGRSSKSFLSEPQYTTLTSSIKKGDYLLIGFGHNDEKGDAGFYTDPTGSVTDSQSFKYFLYTYYIKVAQDKGATPILCTPIVRRDSSGAYANGTGFVHVTGNSGALKGGDYAQAIRDLGKELKITVIDNTALTKALGQSIFANSGATGTAKLQAWTSSAIGSVDDTHTNIYGASYYAYLIASALTKSNNPLKRYVLSDIAPPLPSILVVNPDYKEITYAAPTEKSKLWTTTNPWWASVFGDIGGSPKLRDGSYAITETPDGVSMHSGTPAGAAGKIATTSDGLAFYFQQIPINKNFTLRATATVRSLSNNDQLSFGLMVRDAVWIDTSDASLLSPYIACGPLKISKKAGALSSFSREFNANSNTFALTNGQTVSSASAVPVVGSVINLSIVKVGAVYTVTFGSEPPATYTVDLNSLDPKNVYAGLYTVRQCQVDFSNISLTIQ